MSFKKWLCVLSAAALCVTCVACGNSNDNEKPDGNEVEVTEPDTTKHNFTLTSGGSGSYTYQCADCGKKETVVISCVSGTQNAYSVSGNTITFNRISERSVYDIQGAFHGNIVIDVSDSQKFELQMSGLELYSFAACPITVQSGDKVTLSAKKSTKNYVFDMREATADENAISASIYALCDLDIQGKGSLNVKSLNNNGIHSKDDLSVKNLSLQVDCKDNALKGNDSVSIESGSVVLIARRGDGIRTTNSDISSKGNQRGTVAITGGDILIYAACDGIGAAYDAVINESTATVNLQIFTDQYSKYSEEVAAASQSAGSNAVADFPGQGGFGHGGPGGGFGPNDGNTDKGDYSTKGIKADNAVTVSAGTVTISAYDDALHASSGTALENGATPLGNVTVTGGSLILRTNDDGIHADGKVLIGGGTVNVVSSYEGIEGNTVEIKSGSVSVVSSDDGVNGTAASGTAITVSGGNLYIYAGGDGVDSNSTSSYAGIVFSGGTSVIISTGQSDSSIDSERGYGYSGGYVIGIGKSGGMGSEATNCSNFSSVGTSKTVSLQKDGYLAVEGIATVKMPVSINALVVCLGKTSASISANSSTSYSLDVNGVYWNK